MNEDVPVPKIIRRFLRHPETKHLAKIFDSVKSGSNTWESDSNSMAKEKKISTYFKQNNPAKNNKSDKKKSEIKESASSSKESDSCTSSSNPPIKKDDSTDEKSDSVVEVKKSSPAKKKKEEESDNSNSSWTHNSSKSNISIGGKNITYLKGNNSKIKDNVTSSEESDSCTSNSKPQLTKDDSSDEKSDSVIQEPNIETLSHDSVVEIEKLLPTKKKMQEEVDDSDSSSSQKNSKSNISRNLDVNVKVKSLSPQVSVNKFHELSSDQRDSRSSDDSLSEKEASHVSINCKKVEGEDESSNQSDSSSNGRKSKSSSPQNVESNHKNAEIFSTIDNKSDNEINAVLKNKFKKPHEVSDSESEEIRKDKRKSFLCSTMLEPENHFCSEPNSLNVSLITPKPKRTMKDFLVSSPKPSQNNILYYEDIDDTVDIFVMQCPQNVDCQNFIGKRIILDGETNINLNNENFDIYTEKDSQSLNIALPTRDGFKFGVFKSCGSILVTESFEVPTVGDFEVTNFQPIHLPEGLKNSFDASKYSNCSALIDVSPDKKNRKREKSKLHQESEEIESIRHSEVKKKKKKKIEQEMESDVHENYEIVSWPTEETSSTKKKKKKKIKQEMESDAHENYEIVSLPTEGTSSSKKKKKKKVKNDADVLLEKYETVPPVVTKSVDLDSTEVAEIASPKKKKKKKENYKQQIETEVLENRETADLVPTKDTSFKKKKKKKVKIDADMLLEKYEMPDVPTATTSAVRLKTKNDEIMELDPTEIAEIALLPKKKKKKKIKQEMETEFHENHETANFLPTEETSFKKKKKKKIKNDNDNMLLEKYEVTDVPVATTSAVRLKPKHDTIMDLDRTEIAEIALLPKKKKKKKIKNEVDPDSVEAQDFQPVDVIIKEEKTDIAVRLKQENKELLNSMATEDSEIALVSKKKKKKKHFLEPLPALSTFREIQSSDENVVHIKPRKKRKRAIDSSTVDEPDTKKNKFHSEEEVSLLSKCIEPVKTKKKKKKKDKTLPS